MYYLVSTNKLDRVNVGEIDSLLESELGYVVSVDFISPYLYIDGVIGNDDLFVISIIDNYLKDPDTVVDTPTTQVIASGLDIRTLNRTRDSISIHDGGNVITVDGEVNLSATTLAALENTNVTLIGTPGVGLDKISGSTISTGAGNTDTGTQRVVLASDNPSIQVGASQAGTWYTRQEIVSSSTTTASYKSAISVSSNVIKNSSGALFKIFGYNSGPAQFIQLFNSTTIPADNAVPVMSWRVQAASNFEIEFGACGIFLNTGISVCNSSTSATKTIGSADCNFMVIYK
jgi:hypothetical protein